MKINLEVTTLENVTTKVTAQFADFIAFEREQNRSVANFQTGWLGMPRNAPRKLH